ncbi:MAG: dephospho-CoA kinase [Nitrospirae bacterium]|nr:dephospho-CoA kinase [Nitrospirota bacterium]
MIVVGLTGNYGMGKSTVSTMFRELGAVTIDTDALVGELLNAPEVIDEIRDTFGETVVRDNSVDRKMLADTVFDSPSRRISLENILHPRVFKKIEERLSVVDKQALVIIEVPLLYERCYQNRFDKIITVYTSEETALRNLSEKGITEEAALKRLKNQFPIAMKVSRADYSIDNSSGLDDTRQQVRNIYLELSAMARGVSSGLSGNIHGNN